MAQRNDPIRGDWYSNVIEIIKEFDLGENEKDIIYIPVKTLKKSVNQKGKVAGIKYLQGQQNKCEKGSGIKYEFLELQDYLRSSSNISLEDQRLLFSLRCEMNQLKTNFTRNESIEPRFCIKSCKQDLDNEHLFFLPKN